MKAHNAITSERANQRYTREVMTAPLLTREREQELARAWRDLSDEASLHELVRAHARLVISTVSQFKGYGLSQTDMVQEGHVGLLQAAQRFDPERDVRFSTYAVWWIRAAIQDYVLRNWSIVRLGTTTAEKSLFFNLRRLRAKIARNSLESLNSDGRDKIADALRVKPEQVADMEARLYHRDQSVNTPLGEGGDVEIVDLLEDDAPDPESVVGERRDGRRRSAWLTEALAKLPAREERIIRERHLGEDGVTLEDLGTQLGISKERVRQLEQRALKTLRGLVLERAQSG